MYTPPDFEAAQDLNSNTEDKQGKLKMGLQIGGWDKEYVCYVAPGIVC